MAFEDFAGEVDEGGGGGGFGDFEPPDIFEPPEIPDLVDGPDFLPRPDGSGFQIGEPPDIFEPPEIPDLVEDPDFLPEPPDASGPRGGFGGGGRGGGSGFTIGGKIKPPSLCDLLPQSLRASFGCGSTAQSTRAARPSVAGLGTLPVLLLIGFALIFLGRR